MGRPLTPSHQPGALAERTIDRFEVGMVERAPRTVAREVVARLATLGYVPARSVARTEHELHFGNGCE